MFPGTGCVIDGSHMNSIDFTLAVIDLAVDAGFEIDHEQYRKEFFNWRVPEEGSDDEALDCELLGTLHSIVDIIPVPKEYEDATS